MVARSTLLILASGLLSAAAFSSSNLPPQLHPVYGGANGTAFTRSCGAGKVLSGLRAREGALVDAVGILCRPVRSDGTLGPESTVGTLVGGSGGTATSDSCAAGRVASGAVVKHGAYVNRIYLYCRVWDPATRKFGGTEHTSSSVGYSLSGGTESSRKCESLSQPVNGIRGRAHSLVDAIGFICDEP